MRKKCYVVIHTALITLASLFGVDVSANTTLTEAGTIQKLLEMDLEDLMKVKVITIATGAKQTETKAPATTTVITAEEIEALGANDLDEVLETLPGLHINRSASVFYRPLYVIQGIYSEANPEVLMLVNGIPITSMYTGDRGYGWGGMPIHAISRIEMIRGPGSAVYGADAFSGVINLITKTKEDLNGTEVGTRVGSFDTYDGWVLHGGSWNGFDLAASLEYHTTNGHQSTIAEDAQTQYDKQFGTHASYAPGPLNTGTDNIDARVDVKTGLWQARAGYQGRYNLGYGVGMTHALDPVGDVNASRTNADLTYHNPTLTSHWDVTTQLSYFDNSFKAYAVFFPPGAFGGTYPDGYLSNAGVRERHLRLDTFAFYAGFQSHLIRIGTGYQHHNQYKTTDVRNYGIDPSTGQDLPPGSPMVDATDTPYVTDREGQRSNWYLSLQEAWTITNEWELTAGLRYDDYSDFGSTVNPRLALVWQSTPTLTTKILYGQAFRSPSFVELYTRDSEYVLMGGPQLKPEKIDTWELALEYRATQTLRLATNLFSSYLSDKLVLLPAPEFRNVGNWKSQGLELEARWKITDQSSLQANYSYARVMNQENHSDISNYPRQSASIHLNWLVIPHWLLDVQANWIADRYRVLGDPRPPIADYSTVDLTVRNKGLLGSSATVAFGVRNLLDANAREPSWGPDSSGVVNIPDDLPLPARNVFMELRYQF